MRFALGLTNSCAKVIVRWNPAREGVKEAKKQVDVNEIGMDDLPAAGFLFARSRGPFAVLVVLLAAAAISPSRHVKYFV